MVWWQEYFIGNIWWLKENYRNIGRRLKKGSKLNRAIERAVKAVAISKDDYSSFMAHAQTAWWFYYIIFL